MKLIRLIQKILFGLLFSLSNLIHAEIQSSIELFSSNNTHLITIEKAYERLNGTAQSELEHTFITLLQKNHIEQGEFENILGIYKKTADNTLLFHTSPKQSLSNKHIFS